MRDNWLEKTIDNLAYLEEVPDFFFTEEELEKDRERNLDEFLIEED